MEKDRALNLLLNGLLPQVHGAYYEALKTAIEALKSEPCGDTISRIEAVNAVWNGTNMDIYTEEVKEILEGLPPVISEDTINQMMYEIYMEGMNMGGEYQGCWVRFRDIERLVNKYLRRV